MMAPPRKKTKENLSHAEIWDDSALIQSWDDALDEYQYYHSIHARGERVEDVLKAVDTEGKVPLHVLEVGESSRDMPLHGPALSDQVSMDGKVTVDNASDAVLARASDEPEQAGQELQSSHQCPPNQADATEPSRKRAEARLPDLPDGVIGGVTQDDALRGLMMSWYYAGYYTGLYDGQQQGKTKGESRSPSLR